MAGKLVAYYRVSTAKQGASGLGREGQVEAVRRYADDYNMRIIGVYEEVESGKRADRPALAKAIAHAKRAGAKLVIAKLDRLSRNLHFLSGIMESGVDFVACDNPHANRLTIHIMAAVAEDEARRISERTRDALAAYKARGGRLGAARPECRNLTDAARRKGAEAGGRAVAVAADAVYADLVPMMAELRSSGLSMQAIADQLNGAGHTTRTGKPWNRMQVSRVLTRS